MKYMNIVIILIEEKIIEKLKKDYIPGIILILI